MVSSAHLAVRGDLGSSSQGVQESKPFELDGRLVTLVEMPGFDAAIGKGSMDVFKQLVEYLRSE